MAAGVEPDRSAHESGDLTRDCQPETAPGRHSAVDPVEAPENGLLVLLRNPGPVVLDGKLRSLPAPAAPNHHSRTCRCVHQGVRDERATDLQNASGVPRRPHAGFGVRLEQMPGRRRQVRQLTGQQLDDLREVDRLSQDTQLAGVDTRQIEEIRRQLGQPLHLTSHRVDEAVSSLVVEVLVGKQLEESTEREQRCSKLVRRVRDERLARIVQLSELDTHPVERIRELADLVVAAVDDQAPKSPPAIRSAAVSSRSSRLASIPAAVRPRTSARRRANTVASSSRCSTRRTVASESARAPETARRRRRRAVPRRLRCRRSHR